MGAKVLRNEVTVISKEEQKDEKAGVNYRRRGVRAYGSDLGRTVGSGSDRTGAHGSGGKKDSLYRKRKMQLNQCKNG